MEQGAELKEKTKWQREETGSYRTMTRGICLWLEQLGSHMSTSGAEPLGNASPDLPFQLCCGRRVRSSLLFGGEGEEAATVKTNKINK